MPRIPSTAYSFLLRSGPVRCRIVCGGALSDEIHDALLWGARESLESACAEALWAQDLQVVADVVGIPISLHAEQESRLVLSFLGGVMAWMTRAAGDE